MANRKPIPEAVRRQVLFNAGKECEECRQLIDGQELLRHLDHIIPDAAGGESVVFNLRQLCHRCNLNKGAKLTARSRQLLALKETRQVELANYFQNTPAFILGNGALREPQSEAYLAIRDYFNGSSAEPRGNRMPALVEIPTGCGKTGIICIAPFGAARGRVLIVAPNLTIKDGIISALSASSPKCFYRKCGIFEKAAHLPKFVVLKTGEVNAEDCLRADIIIANVQQIQGWLHLFESDFFDLVLFDEAHHTPAETWRAVRDKFPRAKVIYLTATPFRADGKPIVAEPVYSYSLASAMSAGYVKKVVRVDAVPSQMTFSVEGEEKEFEYQDIMAMREELWFSRGVAMSEASNLTIIDKSLDILAEKRRSGINHQIIAAAMSVRHARSIVTLYETRKVRATFVASDLPVEERSHRLSAFEAGKYDAIVHVGILGEGYDHPPISIAAIFRPFRSLSPYAQFIGRTLRRIEGAGESDSTAHVVAHIGLNLDELWDYFKHEVRQAEIFREFDELDREVEEGSRRKNRTKSEGEDVACVKAEEVDRFDVDTFVPMPVDAATLRKVEKVQLAIAQLESLKAEGMPVEHNLRDLNQQLLSLKHPLETRDAQPARNRPDLERGQYRKVLNAEIRRAAGFIVESLEIPRDASLVPVIGKGEERSNYEAVIRAVNRAVNRAMGKDGSKSERNEWTIEELKEARSLVNLVRDRALEELRGLVEEQEIPF
ncbi:MAG: DEAD/DEAH box helicase family protein [Oscillatoria princeps RMCB-10]|jgi:superfamily II DNA or RNA helicase|nr:DEAD/DEAH box helicase family protein [Oscillatoria princeps RMCB-10]